MRVRGLALLALVGCRTPPPPAPAPPVQASDDKTAATVLADEALRSEVEQRYAAAFPVSCCPPAPCGDAACEQDRQRAAEAERDRELKYARRFGESSLEALRRRHAQWVAQRCTGVRC